MSVSPAAYLILVAVRGAGLSGILGPGTAVVPPLGKVFPLLPGRNIIGRSSACEVVLPWLHISRRQAVVEFFANGSWEIEDLQSRNGTGVNGTKIQAGSLVPLSEGDHIQIPDQGNIELLFTLQLPIPSPDRYEKSQQEDEFANQTCSPAGCSS